METIKLTHELIDVFFGGMDLDELKELEELAEQGAVLDPTSGEIILHNTGTGIYTDYFIKAFYLNEDERPYQVGSEKLVVASQKNSYGEDYQYICIGESPIGSDGWDLAMAWDPNNKECYGSDFKVYQLRVETAKDEWEEFPIWFDNREDATIYFN